MRKQPSEVLWSISTHPLLLIFVGSVVGSILIPIVSERINRKKIYREAGLRKAVEIVDNNTRTLSQLNTIVTRLNIFHDDNVRLRPSPKKLSELQDRLADDINSRYLDFEKNGWWWYRHLNDEAVIMKIVPPNGSEKLRKDIDAYALNVGETVGAFQDFWHICLSKEYDFEKDGKVTQIRKKMDARMAELANQRIALVNNLVQDFTPSD